MTEGRNYSPEERKWVWSAKIGTGPSSIIVLRYPYKPEAGKHILFRNADESRGEVKRGVITDIGADGRLFIELM